MRLSQAPRLRLGFCRAGKSDPPTSYVSCRDADLVGAEDQVQAPGDIGCRLRQATINHDGNGASPPAQSTRGQCHFGAAFEEAGLRNTAPRRLIARSLAQHAADQTDFATEELWHELRQVQPNLGRATCFAPSIFWRLWEFSTASSLATGRAGTACVVLDTTII